MELKCNNPNDEIVLRIRLNLSFVENCILNEYNKKI